MAKLDISRLRRVDVATCARRCMSSSKKRTGSFGGIGCCFVPCLRGGSCGCGMDLVALVEKLYTQGILTMLGYNCKTLSPTTE